MTSDQEKLSVTMVVGEFPALSETFVLDQVIYLIERGHDVRIVAHEARAEAAVHGEVARYALLGRTQYLAKPKSALAKLSLIGAAIAAARLRFIRIALATCFARFLDGEAGNVTTLAALVLTFAEREQPDVFLCHFGQNGSMALRAVEALGWRVPVATIFHGFDLTMLVKQNGPRMYTHLLSRGALFLPVCDYFATLLLKMNAPPNRVTVQRLCVGTAKLDELATPSPTTVGSSAYTFIAIARLVEKKGHAFLLAAFHRAFAHMPPGEVRLLIIGEGKLRPEIETAAQLNPSIQFLGALSRVETLNMLVLADVVVQPSVTASDGDMEGLPLVISEAMALQKPVIATFHSGIPELVIDGVTGLLVQERDDVALAEAMMWMRSNAVAAERMGAAGRHRLMQGFDVSHWNQLLEKRLSRTC